MVYRALILPVCLVLISGCVAAGPKKEVIKKGPKRMTDVYAQSVGDAQQDVAKFVEENLKEQKTFGYVKPYIPVVQEPIVRKVWIPDHKSSEDASVLIGGHWVYLMIQGPRWFIDQEAAETKVPVIVPTKLIAQEK